MKRYRYILLFSLLTLLCACSATKYVPTGKYLLHKNELVLKADKSAPIKLDKSTIEEYIQQRPNKRLLGIGLPLALYNSTDTAKNNWWQRFWRNNAGQAPVIYDSALTVKSTKEIDLYLISKGYFNSHVSDSLYVSKKRKATVVYDVNSGSPYTINRIKYNIADKFLEKVVFADTVNRLINSGDQFQNERLEKERLRIGNYLRNEGFWGFGINYINYTADSTVGNHKVNITVNIRQQVESINRQGKETLSNHPIYRLNRIIVNTAFDPSVNIQQEQNTKYDSIEYNGITIYYHKSLLMRPKVLVEAIRLSPNTLFTQSGVVNTSNNLRQLGYSANILFNPLPNNLKDPIMVTMADPENETVSTTEQLLDCHIQCSPFNRHSFNTEFEASTTSDYYSLALGLGYSNRNAFKGAEVFNINFRGAYEFVKAKGANNAYEFGISASLSAPRFWLPISTDKAARFKNASSKISLSYSIQNRPYYRRSLFSGVFGYGWTFKNGGKFVINPADINVVDVPWVDENFLDRITNPYLRNSYHSQLIAGASTSYYYNTNSNVNANGFIFKVNGDINGNLFQGLSAMFGAPTTDEDGESYYKLFGLRFAQYVRASVEVSGRSSISPSTQIAWRAMLAGGYAYGNSNTVPFERLFFAGGSNSMRGWQVRTLGPGSVEYYNEDLVYPNQLGDMKFEMNLEFRQHVIYGLSVALFFDAGNIWMNSIGEDREEAKFNFKTFYKQIALNTGLGIRYNIADLMILRLDWGLKLHNPNMPINHRWFTNMAFKDTAFHFAIGLPF